LDSSFSSELDFLRRGCTELDLNRSGKTPKARERFVIVVMVGRRAEVHFFSRVEGIGLRSRGVSGDSLISLDTAAKVVGPKISKRGM
jgi:hypothetical protein